MHPCFPRRLPDGWGDSAVVAWLRPQLTSCASKNVGPALDLQRSCQPLPTCLRQGKNMQRFSRCQIHFVENCTVAVEIMILFCCGEATAGRELQCLPPMPALGYWRFRGLLQSKADWKRTQRTLRALVELWDARRCLFSFVNEVEYRNDFCQSFGAKQLSSVQNLHDEITWGTCSGVALA